MPKGTKLYLLNPNNLLFVIAVYVIQASEISHQVRNDLNRIADTYINTPPAEISPINSRLLD